jgi:hypothetical protein
MFLDYCVGLLLWRRGAKLPVLEGGIFGSGGNYRLHSFGNGMGVLNGGCSTRVELDYRFCVGW